MSPSAERSSSGVRNLRSLFENKNRSSSGSPEIRGRAGAIDQDGSRHTSRVRASFVSVEGLPEGTTMATTDAPTTREDSQRSSSAGQRRGSFSEGSDDGKAHAVSNLKKTVSEEVERRQEGEVAETIPEAAVESASGTPSVGTPQPTAAAGTATKAAEPLAKTDDQAPANPDKPTTAAEEAPAAMKPAEPSSEEAVSGGQALPPVAEDLRKTEPAAAADVTETKALEEPAKTPSKQPTSIKATEKATKAFKSVKAAVKPNATAAKSEAKSEPHPKAPTKKPSRTPLTTSAKPPIQPQPKPRETTKPIDLPSRLTAPTAASRAKHEPPPTNTIPSKPNGTAAAAVAAKPKPASSRPTPRTSLTAGQRPTSRTSTNGGQKPAAASESFLERMMRPTAASANKAHEKPVEIKSPLRASKALPVRPKTNGHAKKPAEKTSSQSTTTKADQASVTGAEEPEAADTTEAAKQEPTSAGEKGNATPLSQDNGDVPGLEATPAFGDKEIR